MTGFDWVYFLAARNESLNAFFRPALFGGFLIPMFLPITLIIVGIFRKKKQYALYGKTLLIAAALGWILSSTYKAFTGRLQPDLYNLTLDISHCFQFGF